MHRRFTLLRGALLSTRWAMAPFCLGLIAALLIVLAQFVRELVAGFGGFGHMSDSEVILAVLKLVDLVLVANLVLMLISAGVEIFLPAPLDDSTRPEWAGLIDFAGIKVRLFAAITAIAAIDLLESFINVGPADKAGIVWDIAMLLAFAVAGVLLAWMDRLAADH